MGRRKARLSPTKAVAYLRRSRDERKQKFSFGSQRRAIQGYAKAEGLEVVDWFEDDGVSGGADIDKRPGLLAALDALETHRTGVLLVWKRDRLARKLFQPALFA